MIVTAAAAACLVLFAGTGYSYYASNFKTHSTIVISTEANITMELNKKGEVLSLKSDTESGKDILRSYSGKGKDKATVANEIIEIEKSKGLISEGDKVEFYVSSTDPDSIDSLQQEMNSIKAKLDTAGEKPGVNHPAPAAPAEKQNGKEVTPPAPADPKADGGPAGAPKADLVQPAEPPAPEPPKANTPADTAPAPEPPAAAETPDADDKLPHEKHEHPEHEDHAAEPPAPEAEKNENKVIHKPHERLPELIVPAPPAPEDDNNESPLPGPPINDPKAEDENPFPDL